MVQFVKSLIIECISKHGILVDECVMVFVCFRLRINMYSEGLMDLMEMIMILPFSTDKNAQLEVIKTKAKGRYLPVFDKVSRCFLYISYKAGCS